MSLFSFGFNHVASRHEYKGINNKGDAEYSPPLSELPASFNCRFEYKRKEVLDKSGNKVISEAQLYTNIELNPLDIIIFNNSRFTVKSVIPRYDIMGNLDHYEVIL